MSSSSPTSSSLHRGISHGVRSCPALGSCLSGSVVSNRAGCVINVIWGEQFSKCIRLGMMDYPKSLSPNFLSLHQLALQVSWFWKTNVSHGVSSPCLLHREPETGTVSTSWVEDSQLQWQVHFTVCHSHLADHNGSQHFLRHWPSTMYSREADTMSFLPPLFRGWTWLRRS